MWIFLFHNFKEIKSTPQVSLKIYVFVKNMAVKSILRLKEPGELKHEHIEHFTILRGMGNSILIQGTIYCKNNIYMKPSRKSNFVFKDYDISVFIDGSTRETVTK